MKQNPTLLKIMLSAFAYDAEKSRVSTTIRQTTKRNELKIAVMAN